MTELRRPRLLMVDNLSEYADPVRDLLISKGWHTELARSPEEALSLVRAKRFHLCIVDKRLRDEHDRDDHSGIELIPQLWRLDGLLKFVLLTQWKEIDEVRALYRGTLFPTLPKQCLDYIPKQDGVDYLIEQLITIEKESLRLNWERDFRTKIDFDQVLEPFMREIAPADRKKRLVELAEDLQWILRWIFYSDAQFPDLKIKLLDARNRSGAQILQVHSAGKQGWILKLASRLAVQEEWECYARYGGGVARRPELDRDKCQQGKYLGAMTYRLVETVLPEDELGNLWQYLLAAQTVEAGEDIVRATVHNARAWFSQERSVGVRDLTAYYMAHFQLQDADLIRRFERPELKTAAFLSEPFFSAENVGGKVMNPLPFIARARFLIESSWNICHGDLNSSNVLVAGIAPWLIDFASTGQGPTALDWVTLEASLKFDVRWSATAEDWFRFEEALATQAALDEPQPPPSGISPELERLYHAITALRVAVVEHADLVSPQQGLLEYLVGLLYATVYQVRFYWREKSKKNFERAHRILASGGLIAERLLGELNRRDDVGALFRWQSDEPRRLPSKLPSAAMLVRSLRGRGATLDQPDLEIPAVDDGSHLVETLRIAHEAFLQRLLADILGNRSTGTTLLSAAQEDLEQALEEEDPADVDKTGIAYRLKLLQRYKNWIQVFERKLATNSDD